MTGKKILPSLIRKLFLDEFDERCFRLMPEDAKARVYVWDEDKKKFVPHGFIAKPVDK